MISRSPTMTSPQKLSLEQDTDREPLALVVAVETGGAGARHLDDYRNLGSTIEALVGDVPHRVALVGFDSEPRVLEDFTSEPMPPLPACTISKPETAAPRSSTASNSPSISYRSSPRNIAGPFCCSARRSITAATSH